MLLPDHALLQRSAFRPLLPDAGHASLIRAEFCRGGRQPDASQLAAIEHLGMLADAVQRSAGRGLFKSLQRRKPVQGVFLWGGVGRGKTCLVDAAVSAMPAGMACRYHQHVFLDRFHATVSIAAGTENRFAEAVLALLGDSRLLVLDEFHAYDIADALILKRAFSVLTERGVALLLTANHRPWHLWPDTPGHAQQARHFDPLVEFLRQSCDFIEVDNARDYRETTAGTGIRRWIVAAAESRVFSQNLDGSFWFDELCGGLHRHADYEQLCCEHNHLVLLDVPKFGPDDGDALRRLIWLVDAAWEALLPMSVTADVGLDTLFDKVGGALEGLLGKDLKRTYSRLLALVSL